MPELNKEFLSSWRAHIYNVNIYKFKSRLDLIDNLEEINKLKDDLKVFFDNIPEEEDIPLYSTESIIPFKDVNNLDIKLRDNIVTLDVPGGDQQIIKSSIKKRGWMLKLLDKRIHQILKTPSNLDVFGKWFESDGHKIFILRNKNILGCLLLHLEEIDRSFYPTNKKVYNHLVKILYQPSGKPYKRNTFKKTKERSFNERNSKKPLCKEKGLNKEVCIKFLHYIFEVNV